MFISRIADNCLDILFPPRCAACRARLDPVSSTKFCDPCDSEINYIFPPFCRVCGLEVHGEEETTPLCGKCLHTPPSFSTVRSLLRYGPTIQQLVHKLKYGCDTTVIPGLLELIKGYDLSAFSEADYVVPVPLHLRRLRKRGLNQAVLLARLFFPEKLELIKADLLIRTRETAPQTKLGGAERRENLKAVFQIRDGFDLDGAEVCLVDDIFTTGTTAEECSKAILAGGAKEVKVLTLARVGAPKRGRRLEWKTS